MLKYFNFLFIMLCYNSVTFSQSQDNNLQKFFFEKKGWEISVSTGLTYFDTKTEENFQSTSRSLSIQKKINENNVFSSKVIFGKLNPRKRIQKLIPSKDQESNPNKVVNKINSRTILEEQGAEQLLGQGDLLITMLGDKLLRVHGPFVKTEEVQAVVDETMRRISKKGKITGAIANKDNVQNIYDNGGRF